MIYDLFFLFIFLLFFAELEYVARIQPPSRQRRSYRFKETFDQGTTGLRSYQLGIQCVWFRPRFRIETFDYIYIFLTHSSDQLHLKK